MSDLGETFRAMNAESKERRTRNRENSAQMLQAAGIEFRSANRGAHLMIKRPDGGRIDFWPGTGKWIDNVSHSKKRGVRPLVHHLKSLEIAWRLATQ